MPRQAETRHAVGARELALMRPEALLVNVARGSVVDERAVAAAVRSGRLRGFASDVFAHEDRQFSDRPDLLDATLVRTPERTLFTPHLGTAIAEDREELARVQARCVLAALRGEPIEGATRA